MKIIQKFFNFSCCIQNSRQSSNFDKLDGYIRKYDGTKYLALFHSNEEYEGMFVRTRYHFMLKGHSNV